MKALSKFVSALSLVAAVITVSPVAFGQESGPMTDADKMAEAGFSGDMKAVANLKKKGVSLDALSSSGNTALMQLADEGRVEDMKKLVAMGASVNTANSEGETALSNAAGSGHDNVVKYLLSKGAKAGLVASGSKECALHRGARSESMAVVKLLKKAAPSRLKQKNAEVKTPADIAKGRGNTALAKFLKP